MAPLAPGRSTGPRTLARGFRPYPRERPTSSDRPVDQPEEPIVSTVRTVVHPGWIAVTGPEVDAVVAAGDRHAEVLAEAAGSGLVGLLEALTAHGLSGAPDFVAAAPSPTGLRLVVRGAGVAVLPDGTRVVSEGRMPWADVDVDLAEGEGEVVLEAPEPEQPRGWRRPARLSGARPDPSAGPGEPEKSPDPAAPAEAPTDVEAEPEPGAAGPEAEAEPVAEPEVEPELEPEVVPTPDLTLPPPPDLTGLPPAARVPVTPAPRSGLIDAVPWRRHTSGAGPTDSQPPSRAPVEPPSPLDEADPVDEPPPPPRAPTEELPVADRQDEAEPAAVHAAPDVTTDRGALPRAEDDLDRPVVLAVLCPAGHPSPPHAGSCRTCGREIPPQQPFPTARPSLGVLRISTGGSVPLDRGVLLGRAPRVNEELPPSQRPHLLRVGGADRDISRNHAEVVLEGWHVLVRDLGSTNGTTVTLPGQEPVRLRPTEDQGIEPGTVVTLADEVVLTYEVEG